MSEFLAVVFLINAVNQAHGAITGRWLFGFGRKRPLTSGRRWAAGVVAPVFVVLTIAALV